MLWHPLIFLPVLVDGRGRRKRSPIWLCSHLIPEIRNAIVEVAGFDYAPLNFIPALVDEREATRRDVLMRA